MKHQIALLGSQVLPIFLGIKEYNPDHVHFLVTNESNVKLDQLADVLEDVEIHSYVCNPYDVKNVREVCESIITQRSGSDEISFNLTGGTKLMLIAAQSVLSEGGFSGFYVDTNNSVTEIPSFVKKKLCYTISTEDFFSLSGHRISSSKRLDSFDHADFNAAEKIQGFSDEGKDFSLITAHFRKIKKIKNFGEELINENLKCTWSLGIITIQKKGKKEYIFESPNVKALFFYGGWWELLVANSLAGWEAGQEILMEVVLPFKIDLKTNKNEIDILINRNNKLIFIECKSGIVSSQDINKIKTIRDTYGGNSSRSVLVCQHKPEKTLFEKCKELSIDVFYIIGEKEERKTFGELIDELKALDRKLFL